MHPIQVLILALLQGAAELFPISSLGHTVIIPGLLGWGNLLQSPTFLPLVVTLHLGTATALLTFFWRDWVALLRGGFKVLLAGKFSPEVDPQGYGRQLALVVVGTVPAGLIGVLFQKTLENLFSEPILAAAFLVANGAVLLTAERLWQARQRQAQKKALAPQFVAFTAQDPTLPRSGTVPPGEIGKSINDMSFGQALIVGFGQSFALLPGISRSGSTMVAGMLSGLSHEAAARFSFLLATPIIFAAGLLEIPTLLHAGGKTLLYALGGGIVAGVVAYLSVRFLMRYFETKRLDPFAYYCVIVGLLAFGYFFLQALNVI
jgi:undecaprenyl-diphosphatase